MGWTIEWFWNDVGSVVGSIGSIQKVIDDAVGIRGGVVVDAVVVDDDWWRHQLPSYSFSSFSSFSFSFLFILINNNDPNTSLESY